MANYYFPLSPGDEAWNSKFTPSWTISEQTTAGGKRRAMTEQSQAQWKIELSFKALTDEQADALQGFYCLRRGALEPFWYKDYGHHKIIAQRLPQLTDGAYQLVANIGGYAEPVYHADNIKVYANGVETNAYTISNGKITTSATGVITADYEYYLRVHFVGNVSVTNKFININTANVTLETVR